jgi:hypothetical protein
MGKSRTDKIGSIKMHPPRQRISLVSIPFVLLFSAFLRARTTPRETFGPQSLRNRSSRRKWTTAWHSRLDHRSFGDTLASSAGNLIPFEGSPWMMGPFPNLHSSLAPARWVFTNQRFVN